MLSSEGLIGGYLLSSSLTWLLAAQLGEADPGSLNTWASIELPSDMTGVFPQSKEREREQEKERMLKIEATTFLQLNLRSDMPSLPLYSVH